MLSRQNALIIFADAAFRAPDAGCGFLAQCGGELLLASRSMQGVSTSVIAAERAAELAFQEALQHFGSPGAVHYVLDSEVVVASVAAGSGSGAVARILTLAESLSVKVTASWIKGRTGSTRGDHFANGVADRLSRLGRDGEVVTFRTPLAIGWQDAILGYDARLNPSNAVPVLSGHEVSALLGISYDEVLTRVRNGDFPVDPVMGGIPKQFVDNLMDEQAPEIAPAF